MDIQTGAGMTVLAGAIQQPKLATDLISQTFEKIGPAQNRSSNSDLDFQRDVLAAASGKGSILNIIA